MHPAIYKQSIGSATKKRRELLAAFAAEMRSGGSVGRAFD
jgi:hypothetical protein